MSSSAPPAEPLVAANDPNLVPSVRRIERLLWGLFLLGLFTATFFAKNLLLPIVLAIIIALTLRPVVRGLQRVGIPPAISGVGIMLAIGVAVFVAVYAASGPVGRMVDRAPEIGRDVRWELRELIESFGQVQEATEQVEEIASGGGGGDGEEPQQVVIEQRGLITQMVGSLASAGTSLLVALILAMFLLASGDFYYRRIVEGVPRFKDKKRTLTIVRDVERQISRYLAAITVINAGLGLCVGCALWLLDMPNAFVWGLGAFLLNFLPYLGAILGTGGVAMIALVTFDSTFHALLCPLAYFALTSIEGQFVTPMLVGRHLSLNTVSVLVTVMVWVWLWGVAGALLAVPVLVVVKVMADNVEGMYRFGRFLGNEHDMDS